MFLLNFTFIFEILGLIISGLIIYFIINTQRFIRNQTRQNKELIQKVDDLSKVIRNQEKE